MVGLITVKSVFFACSLFRDLGDFVKIPGREYTTFGSTAHGRKSKGRKSKGRKSKVKITLISSSFVILKAMKMVLEIVMNFCHWTICMQPIVYC